MRGAEAHTGADRHRGGENQRQALRCTVHPKGKLGTAPCTNTCQRCIPKRETNNTAQRSLPNCVRTFRTIVRFKAIACARQCTTWCSSQPKPQPLLKLHTNFRAALQFDGCCSAFNASNTAPLSSDDTHACRVRVAHGGTPAVVNRCYAPHHIPSLPHYMITSLHGQLPKPMSWDGFHGRRAAVNTAAWTPHKAAPPPWVAG